MDRLRVENISKRFPGVQALSDVSFTVATGEVHALCGENGAGKSTLMNILSGNVRADEGRLYLNGERVQFASAQEAFNQGISIVHQHLSLIESISAAENIFLNRQPRTSTGLINYGKLRYNAQKLLSDLGIEIDPDAPVMRLSPAEKQMIEIAKALAREPQLLILDEPTASLTDKETAVLFKLLGDLMLRDISVIYISHRLAEIDLIATRVSVLKDGTYQGTYVKKDLSRDILISKMIGRELLKTNRDYTTAGAPILQVNNISSDAFTNVSFEVRRREIVGLAGLVGAGRTEIAQAIFGARAFEGEIIFKMKAFKPRHPQDAIRNGIAYVPEERKRLSLFPDMSVKDNVIAASLNTTTKGSFYRESDNMSATEEVITKFKVATTGAGQKVTTLSGGNQQKIVLGKWLLTTPDLLIVDEPTHGVDVGAKSEIYEVLFQLANSGKAILVISSELPELLAICDRILVIKAGELAGELDAAEATEEKVMTLAT